MLTIEAVNALMLTVVNWKSARRRGGREAEGGGLLICSNWSDSFPINILQTLKCTVLGAFGCQREQKCDAKCDEICKEKERIKRTAVFVKCSPELWYGFRVSTAAKMRCRMR
jgi:hypothetical protein